VRKGGWPRGLGVWIVCGLFDDLNGRKRQIWSGRRFCDGDQFAENE
jgi:hypothetical protein